MRARSGVVKLAWMNVTTQRRLAAIGALLFGFGQSARALARIVAGHEPAGSNAN